MKIRINEKDFNQNNIFLYTGANKKQRFLEIPKIATIFDANRGPFFTKEKITGPGPSIQMTSILDVTNKK